MVKMDRRFILNHNRLDKYSDKYIDINTDKVIFKASGDYVIEVVDSDHFDIDFNVLENVIVRLFIFSRDNDLKISNHYVLDAHSELYQYQFFDNYNVIDHSVIDMVGENSKYYLGFSSISHGNEEYHIIVNHCNHHVSSDINFKCIGLDKSHIYIQIDSNLEKGNIDCVMDQNSRILTLGDVDACIVPNMFIEEDSVVARHGSVIGSFTQDEMFYLMSRGISYDEAMLLLVKGFLFSNMAVDLEKREIIMNSILRMRR